MITDINQLDFDKHYTYADYLTWQFKERVELIKGKILKMSPAPSMYHQHIVGNIYAELRASLKANKHQKCEAFIAPVDICLPISLKDEKEDTVVQPDVVVICGDKNELIKLKRFVGVPNLVVEVLSPGNTKREMQEKFKLYQEAGVPEYWLVDPTNESIIIYTLNDNNTYIGSPFYLNNDIVKSKSLNDFQLTVKEIF